MFGRAPPQFARFSPDCLVLLAMTTRRDEALASIRALLEQSGVEAPEREARLLLCAAAGLTSADLIRDPLAPLEEASRARLRAFAARRAAREPLSRILGRREFWSLKLAIGPAVLDPRADTETLVSAALTAFSPRRGQFLRILDLGTGSGAILCALLKEFPAAQGVALDISVAAALIARANLAACGLSERSCVVVGCWGDCLCGAFDVIVANPPYIASSEIPVLAPEVRDHDPLLALDGGADGLDAYRALAPALARLLKPAGGQFFVEIGADQGRSGVAILESAGLRALRVIDDLAGHPRVIAGGRA
jgi:release factor glutamine methyltransferase